MSASAVAAGASLAAAPAGALGPSMEPAGRLRGKIAVVTGAARGIGRAIAVAMAREGADVLGLDIAGPVSPILSVKPATPQDLAETGRLILDAGRRFVGVVADVRDLQALRAASVRAEKELGKVDIVVADAGIQVFKPLLEMEDREWQDILDVNLTGVANTLRAFVPPMIARRRGRVVIVASGQGRFGTKHASSYSASKWGVIGLMKSVALEWGEHGVAVNAVVPGLVDTALTRNPARWREAIGETKKNPPENPTEAEAIEALKPKSPLGVPWMKPEDIAPAAVFLASDDAAMVTGSDYDVTSGTSAHNTP